MHDSQTTSQFVQLFASSQRRLYGFIRAQVLSPVDADDILQETSLVLWEKFDQFQPGSDFAAWACKIARLEVLTHHRHARRLAPLFHSAVAEQLAEELVELSATVDARHTALDGCLKKLSAADRKLVTARYRSEASVKELATQVGRTESTVYKALARIHDALAECIEATLRARPS